MMDPATLPALYAMETEGTCMLPLITAGTKLAFAPAAEVRTGDLVAIWFKDGQQPEGALQVLVKRLISYPPERLRFQWHGIAPAATFEQINPRIIYGWAIDRFQAMHKCVGIVVDGKFMPVDFASALAGLPRRLAPISTAA